MGNKYGEEKGGGGGHNKQIKRVVGKEWVITKEGECDISREQRESVKEARSENVPKTGEKERERAPQLSYYKNSLQRK